MKIPTKPTKDEVKSFAINAGIVIALLISIYWVAFLVIYTALAITHNL